ncbi:hypothetical protein BDM02DRAFT_3193578 [Thelephora ganbajun]|uniref:Uncharacterized protein n=1 Tax=Thelephora ganbajun TaxID=370292 RepID=A0ACB6YYC6_THEGA|nr:hypothetical protein BDM02DRAFT_3193578 [Thelephora ganbajun]
MILIVLHEREHERQVPSNVPNQQPSHDAPDLSSAERQSEVQNWVECEDRGTVTEQPPEVSPECISEDDHIGEEVDDSVQLGSRERDHRDTTLGATVTPVDVLRERAWGFGALKAVLGTISAIYANHEEAVGVRNKIEDLLSRIEALEARFATPPGNLVEQRRRSELIRYGIIPP